MNQSDILWLPSPDGAARGTILGCLLLLAGAAALKIAFWIGDDPVPPRTAVIAAWFVGSGAAVAIMQGAALVLLGLASDIAKAMGLA